MPLANVKLETIHCDLLVCVDKETSLHEVRPSGIGNCHKLTLSEQLVSPVSRTREGH